MKNLIFPPKNHINVASKKNLALRLIIDAKINITKLKKPHKGYQRENHLNGVLDKEAN